MFARPSSPWLLPIFLILATIVVYAYILLSLRNWDVYLSHDLPAICRAWKSETAEEHTQDDPELVRECSEAEATGYR